MISKRAQNTLKLIRKGRYFGCHASNSPASIKELADAGLIVRAGRPITIGAFWVPATDYTPYVEERFGPVTNRMGDALLLAFFEHGKNIRRACWPAGDYISADGADGGTVWYYDASEDDLFEPHKLGFHDLAAGDWEVLP